MDAIFAFRANLFVILAIVLLLDVYVSISSLTDCYSTKPNQILLSFKLLSWLIVFLFFTAF